MPGPVSSPGKEAILGFIIAALKKKGADVKDTKAMEAIAEAIDLSIKSSIAP
jgi:hypothetical protein